MKKRMTMMLVLDAASISEAGAQQYVYPAKGQAQQQQQAGHATAAAILPRSARCMS